MSAIDEFKFRALTSEDWIKGNLENLVTEDVVKLGDKVVKLGDEKEGTYTSQLLDSGIESCRWHRIVLDADIPENATLEVSFWTTDKQEVVGNWSGTIIFKDIKDALVEAPAGRYIKLRIKFYRRDIEVQSPVLRQVKIYYPRFSYLRYLPATYQEDAKSKEFLERFLSIFESFLYDKEEIISEISRYFDPIAAPEDFYNWLANWLSLDLYELWEEKNREFILRAVEFYKQKGTVSGIANLVSFLTGKKCCVKEYMNNVFRSYGMDKCRENENEEIDSWECKKFYRKVSKTVDTNDSKLLRNIGEKIYEDELHYVTGTGKYDTPYFRNGIGIFIYINSPEEEFRREDELHKIIDSFLPVFVKVKIILKEEVDYYEVYKINLIIDEYEHKIHAKKEEEYKNVQGVYADSTNWSWLYTCYEGYNGYTNDLQYRTPHSKIGVELQL